MRDSPASTSSATSSRATTTPRPSARAPTLRWSWPACGRPAATTPARRCSGTPPSTPGSPPVRLDAGQPNYTEINAQAALADPDSVLHHYRRLIQLRHTEPTVAHGDFHMLLADHEQVYAFTRRHGDTELLVLGNFSGGSVTVDIPDAAGWLGAELILTNIPAADAPQAQLTLGPWESRTYRRRRTHPCTAVLGRLGSSVERENHGQVLWRALAESTSTNLWRASGEEAGGVAGPA